MRLPDITQKWFDKVVEWDRNLAKKIQDKYNLTDYQMLCLAFAKGFIIGAIILQEKIMQKFINAIAIASGIISLTVVGSGVVIYLQKDAIIENVKSKVMGSVLDSVKPDLGGIAGDSIPSFTGPAAPLPSAPAVPF